MSNRKIIDELYFGKRLNNIVETFCKKYLYASEGENIKIEEILIKPNIYDDDCCDNFLDVFVRTSNKKQFNFKINDTQCLYCGDDFYSTMWVKEILETVKGTKIEKEYLKNYATNLYKKISDMFYDSGFNFIPFEADQKIAILEELKNNISDFQQAILEQKNPTDYFLNSIFNENKKSTKK